MSDYLVIQLARLGDLLQSRRLILSVQEDAKASGGQVFLLVDQNLSVLACRAYPFATVVSVLAHGGSRTDTQVLAHGMKTFTSLATMQFAQVYNLNRSALSLALVGMFPAERVRGYRLENGQPVSSVWTRMAMRWTGNRRTAPMNLADFWAYFHPSPIAPAKVNPVARSGQSTLRAPAEHSMQNLGTQSRGAQSNDVQKNDSQSRDTQISGTQQKNAQYAATQLSSTLGNDTQQNSVQSAPQNSSVREQPIGIALSGRESRRSLPPDLLARCVDALFAARRGPRIVLYGSRSEEQAAARVLSRLNKQTASRVENLCGKTAIEDLPDAMSGLDLFFTPDTGLMHMAVFLGVPVMAVFLSSAWAYETGPYGMGHTVWQAVEPCSPCLESAPCPHQTACRNVFDSPEWQEHLAGRIYGSEKGWSAWPAGLLGLVSTLDPVGVTYHCVDGNEDAITPAKRLAKRRLVAEWLHAMPASCTLPEHAVQELFEMRDAILPDYQ